jgi:hypothetical protein
MPEIMGNQYYPDKRVIQPLPLPQSHLSKRDVLTLDPGASWRAWCWRNAREQAWQTTPREVALRRLSRAEALGIPYCRYTLEILERGVHL